MWTQSASAKKATCEAAEMHTHAFELDLNQNAVTAACPLACSAAPHGAGRARIFIGMLTPAWLTALMCARHAAMHYKSLISLTI